uniref:Uncharacterized protein n=1 Tax=Anguilla anguilla TaxID=7936 RepID=A0A0E9U8X5_ANGAN
MLICQFIIQLCALQGVGLGYLTVRY